MGMGWKWEYNQSARRNMSVHHHRSATIEQAREHRQMGMGWWPPPSPGRRRPGRPHDPAEKAGGERWWRPGAARGIQQRGRVEQRGRQQGSESAAPWATTGMGGTSLAPPPKERHERGGAEQAKERMRWWWWHEVAAAGMRNHEEL